MRSRLLGPVLVALLLAAGCSLTPDHQAPRPTAALVKDRLPAVVLQPLGPGAPVDLKTLRGPAVINLWAWWCDACKTEMPFYAAFAKKYAGSLHVLGIDFQETSTAGALKLMHDSGVTYPVVGDPGGEFRAIGLPKLLLVDATGKVVYNEYVEIKSEAELEQLVAAHLGINRS